jgi:hypothetical protein
MFDDQLIIKAENAECWESGRLGSVLEIEMSIVPSVSVELKTDVDEWEAPTG